MSPSSILITGASSGLGEALALAYARPGATLFLSGRDAQRLDETAAACRRQGAETHAKVISVTDATLMQDWIEHCDETHPLDLVIANAGISGGTSASDGRGEAETTRAIFATNIDGLANTVLPAIARMRPRRRGQIAIMASLAGFRGMPSAPAYCASKAAARVWGEGLRGQLAADNIGVSVICPGFVKSRITARNRFPMPFLMETKDAARLMQRGIAANRARIAYPWPMALSAWLLAALPPAWTDALLARLPAKE